jgi:hypothetical protein
MQPEKSFSSSPSQQGLNEAGQQNIQISMSFSKEIRMMGEKCRSWSAETSSLACEGILKTSAFVCDSLASSMEACMGIMGEQMSDTAQSKPESKKSCCS